MGAGHDDIQTILSSPLFTDNHFKISSAKRLDYQWIIILAIYTGARLEEIGRLTLSDINIEQDIPYILIHPDESIGKTVKNTASIRKVPIHSQLTKLGFLQFVDNARNKNQQYLFPTLFEPKTIKGKCTHNYSKWFGRYRKSIG